MIASSQLPFSVSTSCPHSTEDRKVGTVEREWALSHWPSRSSGVTPLMSCNSFLPGLLRWEASHCLATSPVCWEKGVQPSGPPLPHGFLVIPSSLAAGLGEEGLLLDVRFFLAPTPMNMGRADQGAGRTLVEAWPHQGSASNCIIPST